MDKVGDPDRDGVCPSYLFHPTSGGRWPAVLMYMDGVGIRPAMLEVGERLATYGYLVLLPNLFYRSGPYQPMNAAQVFADPEQRQMLRQRSARTSARARSCADTEAFLAYLAARPDVKPGPVGITGYCMGGRMALAAVGTYPERVAAVAATTRAGWPATRPTARTCWRRDQGAGLRGRRQRQSVLPRRHEGAPRGGADQRGRQSPAGDLPGEARLGAARYAGPRRRGHSSVLRSVTC